MKIARLATLLLVLVLTPGCAFLGWTRKVEVIHPRVTTESGVEYEDIIVGEGPTAEVEQSLLLDYTGYLADGSLFDSSIDRGIPISITLGSAPLEGWNEGLLGMRAGGRRWMSLPAALAYGAEGVPGLIPENEPLVFEIALIAIE
jgi:FKBP-type peptidyl-prolyl cis-trans isomerase